MGGRMDGWMIVWVDGKVNSFDGWMNRFMVGLEQWLDDWLAEWLGGWMDGSIDIWIHKWIYIHTYIHTYILDGPRKSSPGP